MSSTQSLHVLRRARSARFARSEDGSAIVFTLFILVAMLMCVGVGIDVMRYEAHRTYVQNSSDRAALAAADLDVFNDVSRTPEGVVADYLSRSGIPPQLATVNVLSTDAGNTVNISTRVQVPTFLLSLVGVPVLDGPAMSTATESINDIEVALVLDNSGSMGGSKLSLLQDAAKNFIDDVVRDDTGEGTVAVSVVPFSTQVNAGDLADRLNLSTEHDFSSCVTFDDADFDDSAVNPAQPLRRTAHIEVWTDSRNPLDINRVCAPMDSRKVTPWSTNKTLLNNRIDAMVAAGNTSIDLGAKWGLALLDPAAAPIVTNMISTGELTNDVQDMPNAYDNPNSRKYLVVMSDGANTTQYDLAPQYKEGDSNIWREKDGTLYFFREENGLYYRQDSGATTTALSGYAEQLTWVEVWDEMSVVWFAIHLARPALGGFWFTYYRDAIVTINGQTKNTRTAEICQAARDAGVTVYTIGVGTYGQGDATLLDCAGTQANFFDIQADQMDEAFGAIARQINQLRLTQ